MSDVRTILAGGDAGSLPHDYPTERMADDRMRELAEARQEIHALREAIAINAEEAAAWKERLLARIRRLEQALAEAEAAAQRH